MSTSRRRKVMRAFKLNEISAVDVPAQEGARMVLMKRADDLKSTSSHAVLAAENANLKVASAGDVEAKEKPETPVDPGTSADDLGNQPTEDDMAEKNAGDQSAELAKKNDEVARLQSIVDLSPEHRAHFDLLPVSKRDDFLTKSDADKDAEIESIEKANPVVYTAEDGTEYRKSDDVRLIKMARERDEDRAEMAKFRIDAEQEQFTKQAEDLLGLIPGEKVEKVATIRAISKIEDEDVRKAALELLDKANKVFKSVMTTRGVTDTVSPANAGVSKAADILKMAVEACAKKDGLSEAKAYEKVLDTPEGQSLYDAARAERIAASRVAN